MHYRVVTTALRNVPCDVDEMLLVANKPIIRRNATNSPIMCTAMRHAGELCSRMFGMLEHVTSLGFQIIIKFYVLQRCLYAGESSANIYLFDVLITRIN